MKVGLVELGLVDVNAPARRELREEVVERLKARLAEEAGLRPEVTEQHHLRNTGPHPGLAGGRDGVALLRETLRGRLQQAALDLVGASPPPPPHGNSTRRHAGYPPS